MIPKLLVEEHGYPHYPGGMPQNPMMHGMRPDFMRENSMFMPPNVVIRANTDIDSLLQVHRRKMLRRAANRKSAQLSRARKKAHLEDLKLENARLQKLIDILDSHPEIIFCVNPEGAITYFPDKSHSLISESVPGFVEEAPTHIDQIFTKESAGNLITHLQCLNDSNVPSYSMSLELITSLPTNPKIVQVKYSKVERNTSAEDSGNISNDFNDEGSITKKIKKNMSEDENQMSGALEPTDPQNSHSTTQTHPGSPTNLQHPCSVNIIESEILNSSSSSNHNESSNSMTQSPTHKPEKEIVEFVCVLHFPDN